MTFGEHIKKVREDLGMSMAEAADDLNVTEELLERLEEGKLKPSDWLIDAISNWYGEDASNLKQIAGMAP